MREFIAIDYILVARAVIFRTRQVQITARVQLSSRKASDTNNVPRA